MKNAVLLVLFPVLLHAQEFQFELQPNAFPVLIDGWAPFSPWAPGFSESTPDFTDIDADGDLDLFVGEFSGKVAYIQNVGNTQVPQFQWITDHMDSLHAWESRSNPDFYDIDADGDLDAIIGSGHVLLIENDGTATQANFTAVPDTLFDTSGNPVFGTHVAILDLDLDGDGDLICGEYQGHLQLYRNIGTPDSFSFYLEDANWLGISVGNSGSADPTLCDIDADGDYDLFIGERYGKIWHYRNDGTAQQYEFTYVTDNYAGIDAGGFSSPEFADIDSDGDYDLFVGREPTGYFGILGDIYYYENTGTPQQAQFQLVTTNYLTTDLGWVSINPQLVDINGDNAPDLIVGATNILNYFQNTGDSVSPSFQFTEEQFQGI